MSAARQLPAVDPVRAEAHALLDRLLDLLRPTPPPAHPPPMPTARDPAAVGRRATGCDAKPLRFRCLREIDSAT